MGKQTFTMNEFLVYVNELPKKIEFAADDINREIAISLQRRVRFRAPNGSTGSLKRVKLQNDGNNIVLAGPEHWFFVNAGMAPDKMIPVEFFEMHQTSPGSTAGKRLFIPDPKGFAMASFHGGKGFVDNSIASLQTDLPKLIERGIAKAFSK